MHAELYELADDIVLYAVDKKGLRTKGDVSLVKAIRRLPSIGR